MNSLLRAGKEVLKAGSRTFASSSFPDRKVAVLGAAGMLDLKTAPDQTAHTQSVFSTALFYFSSSFSIFFFKFKFREGYYNFNASLT
jgi:hypothetical protein